MSTPYEQTGRTRQKSRTREALVAAARGLVAQGGLVPTGAEAAEAAAGSRTAAPPEGVATSMLPADAGSDPEERLELAVRGFMAMVVDTEAQQRTMLRLSLEAGPPARELPLRQGRAIAWFCQALEPL